MCVSQEEALLLWFIIKVEETNESLSDGRDCRAHEPGWKQSIVHGNGALRGYGARRLHHGSGPHSGGYFSGTRFREVSTH